jgi:hypothetical protein
MTTYTAITNSQIDQDSPITTGLMTQIRDNPIAISEGSSGAPKIQEAALDSAIVSQSKLKSSLASYSVTTTGVVVLAGGRFGFYPTFQNTAGIATTTAQLMSARNPGTESTELSITALSGGGTMTIRQQYITASPPYALGDTDVPVFTFLLVNKSSGIIEKSYIAQDPPWANNGPTDIMPDYYEVRNGERVGFKKVRKIANKLDYVRSGVAICDEEVKEVCRHFKNADMDALPHPFPDIDTTTHEVVMLDPLCRVNQRFYELNQIGVEVSDIIHEHLKLNNDALDCVSPKGVKIVKGLIK